MRRNDLEVDLWRRVCCDQAEAMEFLAGWARYVHQIDDIIDGERTTPEEILETFALAAVLYGQPFYLRHLERLQGLVLAITNLYADAVAWERDATEWKRQWADHARHVGMEMVVAVAMICGGYEHGRLMSREQREICWIDHHDREGRAV